MCIICGEENIFVVDSGNHRIQVFGTNGRLIRLWGNEGSNIMFEYPEQCTIGRNGIIYVPDSMNRIQLFNYNGTRIGQYGGTTGNADGELNNPRDIAIGNDGMIWIADC